MKATDLHNGIRRAIRSLQPHPTTSANCRRFIVAQHQTSLPIRTFASVPSRRAEVEPPKDERVTSLPDTGSEDSGFPPDRRDEEVPEFTAAPELEMDDANVDIGLESLLSLDKVGTAQAVMDNKSKEPSDPSAGREPEEAEGSILKRLRVVPASPSYFTSRPVFIDHYLQVAALHRKYKLLPTVSSTDSRITWITQTEYMTSIGQENVQSGRFRNLIEMAARLTRINHHLMPADVRPVVERFITREEPLTKLRRPHKLDRFGRAYGLGKRKSAVARAWIVKGDGQVMINGKSLSQYFARLHQRESAIYGLKITERVGDYNVFVVAEGGGNTGQAEAVALAVSRALLVYEPHLLNQLKSSGVLRRDPRRVERKKPGKLKARKMPAWVKR